MLLRTNSTNNFIRYILIKKKKRNSTTCRPPIKKKQYKTIFKIKPAGVEPEMNTSHIYVYKNNNT